MADKEFMILRILLKKVKPSSVWGVNKCDIENIIVLRVVLILGASLF